MGIFGIRSKLMNDENGEEGESDEIPERYRSFLMQWRGGVSRPQRPYVKSGTLVKTSWRAMVVKPSRP